MSKKRKLEQRAKQNDVIQRMEEAAQQKVNGEEVEEPKRGFMDVIRRSKPPKFNADEELKEAEGAEAFEAEPVETVPESEAAPEPIEETPQEPEPAKKPEEPPAWAMELVNSQRSFQDTVEKVLLKTGKALDRHDHKLKDLEGRISDLEAWKETAMKAEKAKAKVKADAEKVEVKAEPEPKEAEKAKPETEPTSKPAPEEKAPIIQAKPDIMVNPEKKIELRMEHGYAGLRPAMGWRARIIENGKVSYSHPFTNIYVANQFATVDFDVEPFYGWIDEDREFQRKMTKEELAEYGRYF